MSIATLDILANIKDVVAVQVATDKDKLTTILMDKKILITIIKGPQVITKLVSTGQSRGASKRASISQATVQKIKIAKKMLKGNVDMIYLFTLLAKLEEYATKVDIKVLTPEALSALKEEFNNAVCKMVLVNKQLAVK